MQELVGVPEKGTLYKKDKKEFQSVTRVTQHRVISQAKWTF